MAVLTRERWNEIIRDINELAANPPDGCEPVTPLDEVPENGKWRKSDIQAAQDKLREICRENEFTEIPRLWKQSILDELHAAIDRGWCGCSPEYLWWKNFDAGLTTWTGTYRELIRSTFAPTATGVLTWQLRRSDGEIVVRFEIGVVNGELVGGDETVSFVYHQAFDHFASETFTPTL